MQLTTEQRIKKAHIALMRHPETALFSGVFMLGQSSVEDNVPTAYTDGVNKKYGRKFVDGLIDAELNALILHENLHVVFRHLLHNKDLFEEDQTTANMAADYVVNDVIVSLKDKSLCSLPKGGLYDPQYHNMQMREVYRLLRKRKEEGKRKSSGGESGGQPGNKSGDQSNDPADAGEYSFDQHDVPKGSGNTIEEAKELDAQIDRAIREGALLAGRLGGNMPRAIEELLEPKTRWQDELREFVTSVTKGKDEYTWRKFNRRVLVNDLYLPTVENETTGEIVVATDTSGSIGQEMFNLFAGELMGICDSVFPEKLRVLWWDTMVHGEQMFMGDYAGLAHMLKPQGGGGTCVSCVSAYINEKKLKPECVIVFTDGYVEDKPNWNIGVPTLWLVTHNRTWTPPSGRKVVFEL